MIEVMVLLSAVSLALSTYGLTAQRKQIKHLQTALTKEQNITRLLSEQVSNPEEHIN